MRMSPEAANFSRMDMLKPTSYENISTFRSRSLPTREPHDTICVIAQNLLLFLPATLAAISLP